MPEFAPLLGSYGKLYANGVEWLGISKFKADLEPQYEDFKMSGSLKTGKKFAGYETSGSFTCYKKAGPNPIRFTDFQDSTKKPPRIEDLLYILDDPQEGIVAYRFNDVQFGSVPIIDAEVGSLVEDEFEIFFDTYEELTEADLK